MLEGDKWIFTIASAVSGNSVHLKIEDERGEIVYIKIDSNYLPKGLGCEGSGKNSWIFNSTSTNIASGEYSHAEGLQTTASGNCGAHAEGYHTTASNNGAHAEGIDSVASGNSSHAEGHQTIASSDHQHVQGKYNIEDAASKYAHIVGNGTSTSARSNAHTIDWNGLGWFAGGLKVGGTSQDDASAKEIALKEDIVQADWNQNDETAPDYVKGRTHYSDYSPGVSLVDEQTITIEDSCIDIPLEVALEVGKTYTVIFNGVEYECEAYQFYDGGAIMLGNASYLGYEGGNYEPFSFDYYPNDESFYLNTDPGEYIISIKEPESGGIHQIDEMYIPDTIARVSDIENLVSPGAGNTEEFIESILPNIIDNGVRYELSIDNGVISPDIAGDYTEFTITADNRADIGYTDDTTDLVIPSVFVKDGVTYKVTSIGEDAFSLCSNLTTITIPNSMTSIGNSAFSRCSSLTNINIPNSMTSIGSQAFYYCRNLTSITIPNSVTYIGDYAFEWCERLSTVYYTGSEEEWDTIGDGGYAPSVWNAEVIYNYTDTTVSKKSNDLILEEWVFTLEDGSKVTKKVLLV